MTDFVMFSAPNVAWTGEIAPESKALLNMNVRFQRIGGTASYATASLHQMKTWPFAIILPKKSWSSPVKNSGLNGSPVADRKSTRLNSSHTVISYAVFCLKKKKKK